MAFLDIGDVEEARSWIDRAAGVATEHPSPFRARKLETWRGVTDAAAGDAGGMRAHLERAVGQATDSGHAAARCEALARLAVEAGCVGVYIGFESPSDEGLAEIRKKFNSRNGREPRAAGRVTCAVHSVSGPAKVWAVSGIAATGIQARSPPPGGCICSVAVILAKPGPL